MMPIQMYCL